MHPAVLVIGMVMLLMLATTIYGAIMVTDLGDKVNTRDAGAVFLVLGGLTLTAIMLWALTHRLIPTPMM